MTSVAPESWPAPELPERPDGAAPPRRTGPDAWPAWTAPVALVAGLVGAFVGGILVVLVAEAAGVDTGGDDTPPGVLLGATALQDVSLIAAAIVFARMTGPVWAAHFGLRPTPFWLGAAAVVVTYVAFAVLLVIWATVVGSPDDEPMLDKLGVDESTLLLVLGIVTVCVAAPLVEELFFRGFFYRALRNWARPAGAAILTGLVFGAMHFSSSPVENLVPLAVFGVLLCGLYQVTGSLYPCIVVHAINNSVAFGLDQDWGWGTAPLAAGSLAACSLIAWTVARRWRPHTR